MIDKPPMLERLWAWNPAAPPYFAGANRPTAVVLAAVGLYAIWPERRGR